MKELRRTVKFACGAMAHLVIGFPQEMSTREFVGLMQKHGISFSVEITEPRTVPKPRRRSRSRVDQSTQDSADALRGE